MSILPEYLCTSSITTPMAFLLIPNISTTDIYTTLPPPLWIEHEQISVQWEQGDLKLFPADVASHYAFIMGITDSPLTSTASTATTSILATPAATPTPLTSGATSSSGATSTSAATSVPSVTTTRSSAQSSSEDHTSTTSTTEGQLRETPKGNEATLKDISDIMFALLGITLVLAA